jgi:hypothetical protein
MRKKEAQVKEILFHKDFGLCYLSKDKIGIIYNGSANNKASAINPKYLINLHNKPILKNTDFKTNQRVKNIQNNRYGVFVDKLSWSADYVLVKYDGCSSHLKEQTHVAFLEPEDQQSGLDVNYKTISPGDRVIAFKRNYSGVRIATDHTHFIELFHSPWNIKCYYEHEMNAFEDLESATKKADLSKFVLGAAVKNKFNYMPRVNGTIASTEIKDMPGFMLIKHKGKKTNPYQVLHALELEVI